MFRQLKYCVLALCVQIVVTTQIVSNEDIEINNKCTYSANKRILNCDKLDNIDEHTAIPQFITPKTRMLFLRNSEKINFRIYHHYSFNYSRLISYQILNSRSFSVDRGAFLGLENVQYMKIRGNVWHEIEDNLFVGLINLEVLNLANNQIKNLSTSCFNNIEKLRTLDLSENALEVIPTDVFKNLSNLETLYINNNHINIIQVNGFSGLDSLNLLYLTNNSLEYMDAKEFNKLQNLKHLSIHFNKIKYISGPLSLPNLSFLQISSNELGELKQNVFEKCQQLLSVDLSKNKLGNLTEKPFLSLHQLRHLNLHDNLIDFEKFSTVHKYATIIHN